MKNGGLLIFWAYIVEMLAAAAIFVCVSWLAGLSAISTFMGDTASAWANMTGVLFAASLTIWVAFTNITATEFGGYLKNRQKYSTYSTAFIAAMIIFFLCTVASVTAMGIKADWFRAVAFFLLLYSGVNVITMVRNATGLVRAYSLFRDELAKARTEQTR